MVSEIVDELLRLYENIVPLFVPVPKLLIVSFTAALPVVAVTVKVWLFDVSEPPVYVRIPLFFVALAVSKLFKPVTLTVVSEPVSSHPLNQVFPILICAVSVELYVAAAVFEEYGRLDISAETTVSPLAVNFTVVAVICDGFKAKIFSS